MLVSLPTSKIIRYLKLDKELENTSTAVKSDMQMSDGPSNHQYCSHCCYCCCPVTMSEQPAGMFSFLFVSIEHLSSATSGKQEYERLNRY